MNYRFLMAGLVLLFLLPPRTCVRAQMTIRQQSFETSTLDDLAYTTAPAAGTFTSNSDVFEVVQAVGTITTAPDGDYFFGARDVNNDDNPRPERDAVLTFDPGVICDLTSARFTFRYNAVGLDGGDEMGYVLEIDGFAETEVILVDGGSGGVSTVGWERGSVAIPGTAGSARLTLFVRQNGGSDYVGFDDIRLTASGTNGGCAAVCGVTASSDNLTFDCLSFDPNSNSDGLSARLPYRGGEVGATVSIDNGATVSGDDPATVADGTLQLAGLREGQSYTLRIEGGDCTAPPVTVSFSVPADFCTPGNLIINEFLADPGTVNDANGDGTMSTSEDEFVELYNAGEVPVILDGCTLEEGSGIFHRFPEGTILQPEEAYVVFAGGTPTTECNSATANVRNFIGLNNGGDVITVRDPDGRVQAQVRYGTSSPTGLPAAPDDESLALYPDGNLSGGYQPHSAMSESGATNSACQANDQSSFSLPVTLTYLGADAGAKAVEVSWTTAAETENDYFEVQRSGAGRRFKTIGRIGGRGRATDYRFVDEAPLIGANYYRLRQVDLDGTTTVSAVVMDIFAGDSELAVYPNPVGERLTIQLPPTNDIEQLSLHYADGRLVRTLVVDRAQVDVSELAAGVYYLRAAGAGGTRTARFVRR